MIRLGTIPYLRPEQACGTAALSRGLAREPPATPSRRGLPLSPILVWNIVLRLSPDHRTPKARQRLFWSLVDQLVQGFPVITHNRSIGAVHPEKCHDLLHDRDQRAKHDCYWRATVRKTTIPSRIGRREVCLLRDHDHMEKHDCHWRAKVRKTN